MRRLICAFVVRIWQNRFSHDAANIISLSHHPDLDCNAVERDSKQLIRLRFCTTQTEGFAFFYMKQYINYSILHSLDKNWRSERPVLNIFFLIQFPSFEPRHEKTCLHVCDQGRLKPACTAIEARQGLEILDIETTGIILSRQQTTKALIRLCGCAGWSAPLLSIYGINRFSHDMVSI